MLVVMSLCMFPMTWKPHHRCRSEVAQSCPTLCDPMDCSLPCSSIHGIFQARVLEWIAISFSRGHSWPRDRTRVSCIVGRRFTIWATRIEVNKWTFKLTCLCMCKRVHLSLHYFSNKGWLKSFFGIKSQILDHLCTTLGCERAGEMK